MHRISAIIISFLWINIIYGEEYLRFEVEPEDNIVKIGGRARLKCLTRNIISIPQITWYFNDVKIVQDPDASDSQKQRRKRNKEDRSTLSDDPYLIQSESNLMSTSSRSFSESPRKNFFRYSNTKKTRRKEHNRKGKRKRKKHEDDDFLYPTMSRYVRSVDETKTIDAKIYGISIKKGRLSIQNFTEKNQGSYFCVAANQDGAIKSNVASLKTAYISNFTSSPQEKFNANHVYAVIPCAMPESRPPAKPRWKVNEEWIEDTVDPYMVLPSGALLIRNVTSLDQSVYRCGAFNSITGELKMAPKSITLEVDEIKPSSQTRMIYPSSDSQQPFNVTAEVHQTNVLLDCISNDDTELKWTRENGIMPDSAKISRAGLSLDVAWDSGQYSCKSPNGSILATYNLNVIAKPVAVILGPDNFSIKDDEIITMECGVHYYTGLHTRWEWYHNGEKLKDANDSKLNVSISIGFSSGYYQCLAINDLGSSHKIFKVEVVKETPESPQPVQSEEYFTAETDSDGVSTPVIDRSRTPTQSTSHTLTWSTSDLDVKLFSIKYYKEPDFVDGAAINYPWNVVNVPGDQRKVVLKNLEPSSTYVVEMVAISQAGTRSDVAMSSFNTGKEPDLTKVSSPDTQVPSTNPDKPRKRGSGGKRNPGGDKDNDANMPKAPSRPQVTAISAHKVSLMWNPRGNGGSPIIGYKIQRKDMEGKFGWETISDSNVYPYEIGNLQRGKTYKFRVIAYNHFGDSQPSSASKPYPKRRRPQLLEDPPYIRDATTQGETDIVIYWKFDNVPPSSISGYYIYHRPTDSDNEEDYKRNVVENPTATSYVLKGLQPEMQYDIKIQAFNSLGRSPFSNVMLIETPEPGGPNSSVTIIDNGLPDPVAAPDVVIPDTDRNDPARDKAYQRNTMFLITGAVIGVVLIILLISVFCYWRRRSEQNSQASPGMKHKNGYIQGKPNHINMKKLDSNGHLTPNSSSDADRYCHSPHDTRCHCSRHHSNHSSLGREVDYSAYPMPHGPGYPGNWSPSNYPNIHSNPMHMYVDHRHPYYPPHGLGRGMPVPGGPPSWWVRGNNGEFCHIVPGDARKLGGDGSIQVMGPYSAPGGHMVMRTYDGNVTTGDYEDSVQRPDNGYHSNEDGTRTSSDSQAEKSDDATHDDDANSAGAATSGVVTLNDDVTIDSRPSSPVADDDNNNDSDRDFVDSSYPETDRPDNPDTLVSEKIVLQSVDSENLPENCDMAVDENTIFLNNNNNTETKST
uniref:brother of CDO-like n=1 Tax=Styela clava TaxID=7725 RepID=UPI00193ADCAF|nr:brother of CDO-like [Styela clava]